MFILNANEPKELLLYLQNQQWLDAEETIISLTKPGEGNMNYVLRVTTESRTFILKQSRAYVEKYPHVPAPEKRIVTESSFYEKISTDRALQKFMPKLIGCDIENNIMAIEDLGQSNDCTYLYDMKEPIKEIELTCLLHYLNKLHHSFKKNILDDELENLEMRKLNHEHIFLYPFLEDNGFDLNTIQDGLQELAKTYKMNIELKSQISLLGSLYLAKGKYLLHGDYYPGSWLKTLSGIKVIDPEFCYYGSREFDLGVLMAHLYLSQQDKSLLANIENEYEAYSELNLEILNGFTGVEIMRRLIGLAQLPVQMNLKTKEQLLEFAKKLILKK
jgi:5-methylthioribose kinase